MENNQAQTPPSKIEYSFLDGTYFQEELTLEEDNLIMAIFESPDMKSLTQLDFNFIKYFVTKKLHVKFLGIVLKSKLGKKITENEINKLKNSELLEVLNDFFTLNALLSTIVKAIGSAFGGMKTTSMSSDSSVNQTASTPA